MKKIIFSVLLLVSTGVLSSTVLLPAKKAEQPAVASFLKNDHGFRKDLGVAD